MISLPEGVHYMIDYFMNLRLYFVSEFYSEWKSILLSIGGLFILSYVAIAIIILMGKIVFFLGSIMIPAAFIVLGILLMFVLHTE